MFSLVIHGQPEQDRKVRLDSLFQESYSDDNYKYFRICTDFYQKKDSHIIKDFYKSRNIFKEGIYEDNLAVHPLGEITTYHENGYVASTTNYLKNRPVGKKETWHENGNPKEVRIYETSDKGKTIFKIIDFWDISGKQLVVSGTGDYNSDNDDEKLNGKLVDSKWVGKLVGFSKKYNLIFTENYENGVLINGESIDVIGTINKYTELESLPSVSGGIESFYRFIATKFRVPQMQGLNGKIYCQFMIKSNGQLSDVKVIKGISKEADQEAVRVVSLSSKWIPAHYRGIAVDCTYQLPISIRDSK